MNVLQDSPAAGGPAPDAVAGSRRSPAEIVADLLREKEAEEAKLRKKFDTKIAKARKSATPVGDRRRTALDFLDRLRDSYRTAHGDILLEEAIVDREITDIFIAALQSNTTIKPAALDAAMLVLNSKPEDEDADAAGGVSHGVAAHGDDANLTDGATSNVGEPLADTQAAGNGNAEHGEHVDGAGTPGADDGHAAAEAGDTASSAALVD